MAIDQIVDLALANLTSPPALAFFFGLLATGLLRANLRLPTPVYTALSMYLLLAIGLKGGLALRSAELTEVIAPAIAAVCLGAAIPFAVFALLRWMSRLDVVDRGAMAAHYGSTSLVTFTAAIALLETLKIPFEGYVATLLTIMEVPGIIVGLMLARTAGRKEKRKSMSAASQEQSVVATAHRASPQPARMSTANTLVMANRRPDIDDVSEPTQSQPEPWKSALREVLFGPSVLLLVGGLAIGFLTGPSGYTRVEPMFSELFTGVLVLFLLHLGCVAGSQIRHISTAGPGLLIFAIIFPLIAGSAGVLTGSVIGLSTGGAALLGILCASASYIAAPAAVSLALPQANEGLCLTASLGITFPFNLAIGIPLLVALAEVVAQR